MKRGLAALTKGDLPGHPFRGNQWTDGGGAQRDEDAASGGRRAAAPVRINHYRGTSADAAEHAFRYGIKRSTWDDRKPSVYVTKSKDAARDYAFAFAQQYMEPFAIVELAIPKGTVLIRDEVDTPDAYNPHNPDPKAYRMEKDVPKEWVRKITVYDKWGNYQYEKVRGKKAEEDTYWVPMLILSDSEKRGLAAILKSGNENSGDKPGHPFRGNQYTDGSSGAAESGTQSDSPKVSFVFNPQTDAEGYGWHEGGYAREWAQSLTKEESEVVSSYVGFSYSDINGILRGSLPTKTESRPATDEERKRLIANDYYPIDLGGGDTLRLEGLSAAVVRDVVDTERVERYTKQAEQLNTLIKDRGLVLREDMMVTRAAYIPGMTPEDFESRVDDVFEEKGFTSTMLGPAQGRATTTGYLTYGIAESKYRRYGGDIVHPEVGTAVKFNIELLEGTKVIGAESVRRARTFGGTSDLDRPVTRSESEIILGSGAKFKIYSVERKDDLVSTGDKGTARTPYIEVTARYIGGGSSERD